MAVDKPVPLEPHSGASQQPALDALGRPERFRDALAVMLGKGGDSGYWMRLLGNENFTFRRVGSLVVTPTELGYAETSAAAPPPRSPFMRLAALKVKGPDRMFPPYIWRARREEIEGLEVRPIRLSDHGAYCSVSIAVRGTRVEFGLKAARPDIPGFLSLLRQVCGAVPSLERSAGPPRTDGAYVIAANQPTVYRFAVLLFHHSKASFLALQDVKADVDRVRDGSWEVRADTYHEQADHYVIDDAHPDQVCHVFVQPDGGIFTQFAQYRKQDDAFAYPFSQYDFVPDSSLTEKWGLSTIPGPLQAPAWAPIRTPDGDTVAEELGAAPVRFKG